MSNYSLEAAAEALIFAAGDPVSLKDIAATLDISKSDAKKLLEDLMEQFNNRKSGIMLRQMDDCYQFCSRPELHDAIASYFDRPSKQSLSRASMEALTIVAYKQPVTRADIEAIRGVNSDGVVNRLLEKGLIEEAGRSDNPGRPMLYQTSLEFLQSVGLESLKDLPILDGLIVEEM